MHVSRSSLPVLTKVPTEVRIRKNNDARKKRSAGSAGSFAESVAEAMTRKFMLAPVEVNSREGKSAAVQKINASGARGKCGGRCECGARGFAREVGNGE